MTRFVTLVTLVLASTMAEHPPSALSQPTLVPGADAGHYTRGRVCSPGTPAFWCAHQKICRRTRKDWAGKPGDSWSLELLIGP